MEPIHNGCTKCGSPDYEDGYVNNHCRECRREMSRYPIVSWVRWMALGVAALFVLSLFNMPQALKATLAYNKGNQLMEARKFVSAEKTFREILQRYPSNFKMNANYAIAAFYNEHYDIADSVLDLWRDRHIEDADMLDKVNGLIRLAKFYNLAEDSVYSLLEDAVDTKERIRIMNAYHITHKEEIAAKLVLATYYQQDSNYKAVISLCEEIRLLEPHITFGHSLLARAYCEEKQFEKGLQVCDHLLSHHAESLPGLLLKAKILLKQKQDKQALLFAQQAYDLEPANAGAIRFLGLAAYFNGNKATLTEMEKQYSFVADSAELASFNDVIHNKISYRD